MHIAVTVLAALGPNLAASAVWDALRYMLSRRLQRDEQPPEAQQRIDSVLAKLEKAPTADKPVGEASGIAD